MRKATTEVLTKLRTLMKDATVCGPGGLDAYIVGAGDAHGSEYICKRDERRAFLSGFSGSSGTAVVTQSHALVWTDGRYYLQAEAQMDQNWTLMKEDLAETLSRDQWLKEHLKSGSRVGLDPFLCSVTDWNNLYTSLSKSGIDLVGVERNLLDIIWGADQPKRPANPIFPLGLEFSGKSWQDKLAEVRTAMQKESLDTLCLTVLEEIAWLFNLRGSDIPFNPVFFSYGIITQDKVKLFLQKEALTQEAVSHLSSLGSEAMVKDYDELADELKSLSSCGPKVWLSPNASYGVYRLVNGAPASQPAAGNAPVLKPTPVALMKAVKNPVELQGFIDCHIRDGAALCIYFAWLEKEVHKGVVTEISGAEKLLQCRSLMANFMGPSFSSISSVGPNASIIHYSPSPDTDRVITSDQVYLLDSGGQYKDGTTDVTRTLHFGTPTAFEKEAFTRVLKGQISLARCIFPNKIKGQMLDSFARKSLWEVGLDYGHGTGHGVGHFLCVHEKPSGISWRYDANDTGLEVNMILSNEPGYYKDGQFGIRLEDLVRVVPTKTKFDFAPFLTFETLTMCPIQTKMMDTSLLSDDEVAYINRYHDTVRGKVGSFLQEMGQVEALDWLNRECAHISVKS